MIHKFKILILFFSIIYSKVCVSQPYIQNKFSNYSIEFLKSINENSEVDRLFNFFNSSIQNDSLKIKLTMLKKTLLDGKGKIKFYIRSIKPDSNLYFVHLYDYENEKSYGDVYLGYTNNIDDFICTFNFKPYTYKSRYSRKELLQYIDKKNLVIYRQKNLPDSILKYKKHINKVLRREFILKRNTLISLDGITENDSIFEIPISTLKGLKNTLITNQKRDEYGYYYSLSGNSSGKNGTIFIDKIKNRYIKFRIDE